jgi:hypothetical protein
MHQDIWLALVGLSLISFLLVLVHFTLLGTLLVRFYRRKKYNNAQMNKQVYTSHKQCSTSYHLIKEYHKQTSLENKQSFKGS